jgi:hypothetical protein
MASLFPVHKMIAGMGYGVDIQSVLFNMLFMIVPGKTADSRHAVPGKSEIRKRGIN